MRFRNRILWITFLSAIVLAGPTVVIVKHVNRSQDLPVAAVAEVDEQSERGRLEQLEAELAAVKALSASTTDSDRNRMQAQLNALKQEMSELGNTLATAETAHEPGAGDVSSGDPSVIADAMATEEEHTRQLAQYLDAALVAEAADPSWSVAATQEVHRSLTDAALEHTQLGEVRCQSTLCRVQVSHDSLEAEQGFIMHLGRLESCRESEGFAQRMERGDGSVVTTMFISRSGHRLPDPFAWNSPQS